MPQVSLYIDERTLKRIQTAAKTENLSLSRYVSQKLRATLEDEWPDNYSDLFGSVTDPSFGVEPVAAPDARREEL